MSGCCGGDANCWKTGCTASRTRAPAGPGAPGDRDSEPRRHRGGRRGGSTFSPPSRRLTRRVSERLRARVATPAAARRGSAAGLWEGLRAIPGVELYGLPPGGHRTPTLSFTLAGRDAIDVATPLRLAAYSWSHGDFYASTVARVLGHERDGLVRAGCAVYTTADEVERLVEGVRHLGVISGHRPLPPTPRRRLSANGQRKFLARGATGGLRVHT